jgi:predicted nucleotide-binding protein
MYNLFIGYVGAADEENEIEVSKTRFLEYTDSEVQVRYKDMSPQAVAELKAFPALFMQEGVTGGAFLGRIVGIKSQGSNYKVAIERDTSVGVIPEDKIQEIALDLGITDWEFNRTHWAVKSTDLIKTLKENKTIKVGAVEKKMAAEESQVQPENVEAVDGEKFNKRQVFIVHGQDEIAKIEVKSFIESLGLEPIILHMQASGGRTIIEKIDYYTNVGYGIVLYTECDIGARRDTLKYRWRARQNVVFEHGYLISKLTRSRVAAIVKGDVETPNDISGVVYIGMKSDQLWKEELKTELRGAGYTI